MSVQPDDTGLWVARTLGRREFALLSGDDVAALGGALHATLFAPGQPLFRQGDAATDVYVIRSGEVSLVHREGRRRVTLAILREGEVVGDVPVLRGDEPYRFSAIARTKSTALRIGGEDLVALLRARPSVTLRWLMTVVERMDRLQQRLLEVTSRDLRGRIVAFLSDELRALGTLEGEATLPIGQETLASIVGASRQSVNRALGTLRRDGLVGVGYGRISIPDVARLLAAA